MDGKVLLWKRFVGGPLDGEAATPAELMTEGIVDRDGHTYGKRVLVVCEQRVLLLAHTLLGTAEMSAALIRSVLRSHPDATDEEP